jgi:hypothetical protein
VDLLEAKAQFDGPERPISLRVAAHEGSIYYDLADAAWRAVEISSHGWRAISASPARFRRTSGMLPVPIPGESNSIQRLRSLVNLKSGNDFVLLIAWLLAALRPQGPYPLLVIAGEQGSAKTVLTKFIRALIDPNIAPVRALPREERELMISANNGHLLAFDNVSGIPEGLSDALCRLASGGSFAVRRLYTDSEEILFQAARPIILNGIEDVITRPDLADRAVFLTLPPVPDEKRRAENELWQEFELARPAILGSLFDGISRGLRHMSSIRPTSVPRMADFVAWIAACEGAYWTPGTFLRAYNSNRRMAVDDAIDADPLAVCVRNLMAERSAWRGTASDLFHAAATIGSVTSIGLASWPKNPRALAARLRRSQPLLRTVGIDIAFHREGSAGNRTITLLSRIAR